MERVSPMPGQVYQSVQNFDSYEAEEGRYETEDLAEAQVITSRVNGSERHKLVVDIDLPALLVPSSTEGHFHLYIDHEIDAEKYMRLLGVMAECGLLEDGYVRASEARGFSAVRLPWIKKEKVNE